MMKKFKGMTLVELIVAIAIFGIIMAGVMNMIRPVQESAADAKIFNYQKNAEEAVVTYIGEQLRYANNILIAEQGAVFETTDNVKNFNGGTYAKGKHTVNSPKDAVEAFACGMGVKNEYGEILKPSHENNGQFFHMIIWDGGVNEYAADTTPATYKGRLLASPTGSDGVTTMKNGYKGVWNVGSTNFKTDGIDKKYLYQVFGNGYFGTIDMYLRMNISEEGLLTLTCDSDYWSNAGAKVRGTSGNGKKNTDSASPTVGTFQLRNYNKGTTASPNYNSHVKFMSTGSGDYGKDKGSTGFASTRSTNKIFYIVYTTDEDLNNIMYGDSDASGHKPTDKADGNFSWGYAYTQASAVDNDAKVEGNDKNTKAEDRIGENYYGAFGTPASFGTGAVASGSGTKNGGTNNGGTNNGGTNNGGSNNGGTNNGGTNNGGTNNGGTNNGGTNNGGSNNGGTEAPAAATYTPSAGFADTYAAAKTSNAKALNDAIIISEEKITYYNYHVESWNNNKVVHGSTTTENKTYVDISKLKDLYPSTNYDWNKVAGMSASDVENIASRVVGLPNHESVSALYSVAQGNDKPYGMADDAWQALKTYFGETPKTVETWQQGADYWSQYSDNKTTTEKVIYKNEWTGETSETPPAGY